MTIQMCEFNDFVECMYRYFLLSDEELLRVTCKRPGMRRVAKRYFIGKKFRKKCYSFIGPDAFQKEMAQYNRKLVR